MSLLSNISKLMKLPPRVAIKKITHELPRMLLAPIRRSFDISGGTCLPPASGKLKSFLSKLDNEVLLEPEISKRIENYLEHKFDLLGSGWVEVSYGMEAKGCAGGKYPAGIKAKFNIANEGWLAAPIHKSNLARSQTAWRMLDKDYSPIDWQVDFKSGYRWCEKTWSRDVPYAHLPGVDIKVPWELARCQHLPQMALVSHGIDKLAREFRNQVLDFIATNPPRFGVNWRCTMDVSIRAANWLLARDIFLRAGHTFDANFEKLFLTSIVEHGTHIMNNLEAGGNHYLADIAGLLFVAAYLPDSDESKQWLEFSSKEIISEILRQFNNDGSNFEMSTCYHRLSAEMAIYSVAMLSALDINVPQEVITRVASMARFTIGVTKPSGEVVQIGDNDSGRFFKLSSELLEENTLRHQHLIAAAAGLFDAESFVYLAGSETFDKYIIETLAGKKYELPSPVVCTKVNESANPSSVIPGASELNSRQFIIAVKDEDLREGLVQYAYPDFGLYVYKSKRVYLAIRCGGDVSKSNGCHAHNDQLSIELTIDGEDLLRDPGSYLYTPDEKMRDAYRSVAAHFAPRLSDGTEPASMKMGTFILGGSSPKCLSFGKNGFIGAHSGFGEEIYRVVEICTRGIRVTDYFPKTFKIEEISTKLTPDELKKYNKISFSPGYGILQEI